MSGGLNQKFLRNPTRFLQDHLILIPDEIPNLRTEPSSDYTFIPVYSKSAFDTQQQRFLPVVKLTIYSEEPEVLGSLHDNSHPIGAYWAPQSDRNLKPILLGQQRRFFFTSELQGSSLAISSGEPKLIFHLSANHNQSHIFRLRNLYQNLHFNIIQPINDYDASANKRTVVIGIRPRLRRRWRFFIQSYVPTELSLPGYRTFFHQNIHYVREYQNREFRLDNP
ncbi:hypothetical protein [Sneathiella limimaris]|uniref:hypothetical protein n=1 Tax=Sneathiella limimaris TaxID=1964213 RepID=UPI00146DDFEF|nr:hypothetical protein [Sneathiella limimaris]